MNTMKFNWLLIEARVIHIINSFARAIALHAYKDNDILSLFNMEIVCS